MPGDTEGPIPKTCHPADKPELGRHPVDVSVIVVSYECRSDLEQCLEAVQKDSEGLNVEVSVVDNASTDSTAEMILEGYPTVDFVANTRNVGFAAANNQALRRCTGRYVFLLNPDAFLAPGALGVLTRFMEAHPDVGAAGPKLLNRDGTLQYSIRRFPSLSNAAFETFFLHRVFPGLTSRFGEVVLDTHAYLEPHQVDWLSGAAMFVRREVVERVGLLDESFFLFSEEVDWLKRMHDAGEGVWYVPDAVAIHRDSDGGVNPELIGQGAHARDQYWRKHANGLHAGVARGLMAFNLAMRFSLWRIAGLGGAEYATSQYRAYGRGLSDFLAGRSLMEKGDAE